MRKNIAAGNWKMNLSLSEALDLVRELTKIEISDRTDVIVAPSFPYLDSVGKVIGNAQRVSLAAQNVHPAGKGAHTGEVSCDMLLDVGVSSVIVGHSERRQDQGEDHEFLKAKVDACLAKGLKVIFCCGELLSVRKAGKEEELVHTQISESLFHLPISAWSNMIIAYEPVWAIGTGEVATPDQAQKMHAHIRNSIRNQYNDQVADDISILYGGSVKPGNAAEIFNQEDVDGGLVGGASLKASDFIQIIESF